eukprot:gene30976-38278_t
MTGVGEIRYPRVAEGVPKQIYTGQFRDGDPHGK